LFCRSSKSSVQRGTTAVFFCESKNQFYTERKSADSSAALRSLPAAIIKGAVFELPSHVFLHPPLLLDSKDARSVLWRGQRPQETRSASTEIGRKRLIRIGELGKSKFEKKTRKTMYTYK